MPSKADHVFALQNMFSSDGWSKYYIPELTTMRDGLVQLLVYDEADEATMKGRTHCIRLLDEILGVEDRIAAEAAELAADRQEAANPMVQSPDAVVS